MNSSAIVVIVVPILMLLFSIIAPNTQTVALNIDIEKLKKKYNKWNGYTLVVGFVMTPILGFIFGAIINGLVLFTAPKLPTDGFLLLPDPSAFYCVGAILALGWVGYVGSFVFKKLLKEDYDEYIHYTNLSSGFDGSKILRLWAFVCEISAFVFLLFSNDYSIKINKNDIVFDDFIGFSDRQYSYNQVKSISYVLNDKNDTILIDRPHHFIKFDDNTNWNTVYRFIDIGTNEQEQQIINYISIQSHVKIDTLLIDP
jgi:hypothetical protein